MLKTKYRQVDNKDPFPSFFIFHHSHFVPPFCLLFVFFPILLSITCSSFILPLFHYSIAILLFFGVKRKHTDCNPEKAGLRFQLQFRWLYTHLQAKQHFSGTGQQKWGEFPLSPHMYCPERMSDLSYMVEFLYWISI